jgi:transposase, IS30 family
MKHLEYCERRSIERCINKGKGVRAIARALGRSPGTISEEIKHGSVNGVYRADRAQKKAELRRKHAKQQCLKVAMDPLLKAYVTKHLKDDQSPEGISGRIRDIDTHIPYASAKAIYTFLDSSHGGPLEHHLYRKRVKRTGGPKRGSTHARDATKVSIEKRPKRANNRTEFGHLEGDFIESGKDGLGSLLVLVERKTRYPFLIYTEDKTTLTINALIAECLNDVPVKSITVDNDVSFQKHEALSELIEATVYFTHPYTSSDKGTVENRNGRIREFVPKRCDISTIPASGIKQAEEHLRTRFMKCLGFRTPAEAWQRELAKAACAKMKKPPEWRCGINT